jgi:hypothetical protein
VSANNGKQWVLLTQGLHIAQMRQFDIQNHSRGTISHDRLSQFLLRTAHADEMKVTPQYSGQRLGYIGIVL